MVPGTVQHVRRALYCSKTQGGAGRERGDTHRKNADRGRAKPHNGTDPHTGQNGGQAQDTPTRVGRALYCLYEYKTYE